LIIVLLVVTILSILSLGMISRMTSEARSSQRNKESTEAFYLAEAAIDKAITKLPGSTTAENRVALGNGEYSLAITVLEAGKKWQVNGTGFVPNAVNARSTRRIEAFLAKKDLPLKFWGYAIYSAGNIDFIGNTYDVNGNVIYANTIENEDRVNGTKENDPSINPLTLLDFTYLRNLAIAQIKPNGENNLYTALDIQRGKAFPPDFWFTRADDTIDNDGDGSVDEYDEWIPNVVYVDTSLVISGNLIAGGFMIVGGDVIQDIDIRGNVAFDGCIYTRGHFENRGGGNSLNINGGIWAGTYATLRGNAKIDYNLAYMEAIRLNINPSTDVQMLSWREE